MIIQDVIDLAKYSELGNTAIKDNDAAIILFMNSGILELYKRFPLKIEEHVIALAEGTTIYTLPTDVLYVLSAYGEAPEGVDTPPPILPINEEDNVYSIFLPNHTQVQIPLSNDGAFVSILYVTKPPRYTVEDLDLELDLPEALIEPLTHYIGYKAHLGIKGGPETETNTHYLRFDRSCKKARELGVAYPMDSWAMSNRMYEKGFV